MKNRTVKWIAVMLAGILAAAPLAGCGKKDEAAATESTSSASTSEEPAEGADVEELTEDSTGIPVSDADLPLEECIVLGEYRGMDLVKNVYAISDEDIRSYANSMAELSEVTDEGATVQEGDVVNLAFEGKIDGKTFKGGTSDSYDLEIGSNTFIEGFEDGMIGMKKGEERDLNLKFPEEYGDEELNGKDVVFHVKVNTISRYPELSEEDLKQAEEELNVNNEQSAQNELIWSAWSAISEASTFMNLRKKDVDKYYAQIEGNLNEQIEMYEMTMEEYCESQGLTEDELKQNMQESAMEMAKEHLLIEALSKAENVTTEDAVYKEKLAELAEMQGLSEEELIEQFGEDYVQEYIMTEVLAQRIVDAANITEQQADEEAMIGEYE